MSSRLKKPNRPREMGGGGLPQQKEAGNHIRKREKIPLHDEADLVNFRSDSLARLLTNQDYLENVSLKPFHTSHIAPPSVIPLYIKNLYEKNATDDEVKLAAKNLKPEDIYIGDLRLMKAKLSLLGEDENRDQENIKENVTVENTFSEEFIFQRSAVEKLASLRKNAQDFKSLAGMESSLNELLENYEKKFEKVEKLQQTRFSQVSIPISQLAPETDVQLAPPQYNPRLISSYLDVQKLASAGLDGKTGYDASGNGNEVNNGLNANMSGPDGNGNNSNVFMGENGFEDFGLMLDGDANIDSNIDSNINSGHSGIKSGNSGLGAGLDSRQNTWSGAPISAQTRPELTMKDENLPFDQDYNKGGLSSAFNEGSVGKLQEDGQKPNIAADNMVDLNQFLADGSGDSGIDEMDALIDFNPENSGGTGADEEPFGVDFLNDIGMDLN